MPIVESTRHRRAPEANAESLKRKYRKFLNKNDLIIVKGDKEGLKLRDQELRRIYAVRKGSHQKKRSLCMRIKRGVIDHNNV